MHVSRGIEMKKNKKLYKIINSSNRVTNEVLTLAKTEMENKIHNKKNKFSILLKKNILLSFIGGSVCLIVLSLILIITSFSNYRPNDLGGSKEYIYTNLQKNKIQSIEKYNYENNKDFIWLKGSENRVSYTLQNVDTIILIEEHATYSGIQYEQYISKRNIQVDIFNNFINATEIWENDIITINYYLDNNSALFYIPLSEYDYYFNFFTTDLTILNQIINTLFEV